MIRFELNGSENTSTTTTIDVSKLEKNKHYAVIISIGHIQGDYATVGIGHFQYAINYVGFSLKKIPGGSSMLDFSYSNNGTSYKIDITTKSIGGVSASGVILFIG